MGTRRVAALIAVSMLMAIPLAGCQLARVGARCRTTDWGDDGGAWVLQCRNGRWVRALTKVQAAVALARIRAAQDPPWAIKSLEPQPHGRLRVRGWAPQYWGIHLMVNGERPGVTPTSPENTPIDGLPWTELDGHEFGFDVLVDSTDVQNSVCLWGMIDGVDGPRSCASVTVAAPSSHGLVHSNLDVVSASDGVIHVVGWTLVSHLPAPVGIRIELGFGDSYYDTVFLDPTDTDDPRPDVGAPYPYAGPNHGFAFDVPVDAPGTYSVCTNDWATAEALTGMNWTITILDMTCRDVDVPPF